MNLFMSKGRSVCKEIRNAIQNFFTKNDASVHGEHYSLVKMHLPCQIGDYTDFYASKEHAINVGALFRGPENALMPNW